MRRSVREAGCLGCGVSRHRVANQFFRQLPEPRVGLFFLWIFRDAENARQHADDIAIENRRRLVEGDAANRAGGVTADSRQRENLVEFSGNLQETT